MSISEEEVMTAMREAITNNNEYILIGGNGSQRRGITKYLKMPSVLLEHQLYCWAKGWGFIGRALCAGRRAAGLRSQPWPAKAYLHHPAKCGRFMGGLRAFYWARARLFMPPHTYLLPYFLLSIILTKNR